MSARGHVVIRVKGECKTVAAIVCSRLRVWPRARSVSPAWTAHAQIYQRPRSAAQTAESSVKRHTRAYVREDGADPSAAAQRKNTSGLVISWQMERDTFRHQAGTRLPVFCTSNIVKHCANSQLMPVLKLFMKLPDIHFLPRPLSDLHSAYRAF